MSTNAENPAFGRTRAGRTHEIAIAAEKTVCCTVLQLGDHVVDALPSELEDVVDDLHFEGDPATDSTRRQLERVLKDETPRRWPWLAAVAAGSTALMFWQIRRRRKNGANANEPAPRRG